MLNYISGLITGLLLGAITYATLNAYVVDSHPEASQKYAEYVRACAS